MANSAHIATPLRVLVSEGNSTSAREAITIMGLSGHMVGLCDPSPWCLARFSRFVWKFHRCPGLRDDPAGFLRFIEELSAARHFDVLLPIHEQGFLFARVRQRLEDRVWLPDSAGCSINWACRSRRRESCNSQASCARSSGFPPSSKPPSAPPAAASGLCATKPTSKPRCGI